MSLTVFCELHAGTPRLDEAGLDHDGVHLELVHREQNDGALLHIEVGVVTSEMVAMVGEISHNLV